MLKKILPPFLALALVACPVPAAALAGAIVPPGNSAANQYTETFPTSKGEEDAQGKKKSGVTAAQVLGAGKAHELEDKGKAGKAVADFAAETSPTVVEPSGEAGSEAGEGEPQGPGKSENGAGGPAGDGNEEGSESSGGAGGGKSPSGGSGAGSADATASSGSSGLGEIASQATGTSSGTLGLWLPVILIAVLARSIAYVWRNRQQRVV